MKVEADDCKARVVIVGYGSHRKGERVNRQVPAKSQALFCYLVVTGRPYSRERLGGLLWGDKSEVKAKANLRQSLSTLWQLFGDALSVALQSNAFNRDGAYWLDVEVFELVLGGR